jgi:hypothetical protein
MRRPVVGWEGFYEVSDDGRVYSMARTVEKSDGTTKALPGREMCRTANSKGYLYVSLSRPGARKSARVHRLVAEAFIPNPERKAEVNHIDGNRANPRLDNLEWTTRSENQAHSARVLGTVKLPKKTKLTEEQVADIRRLHRPMEFGYKRLARLYDINATTVRQILSREIWAHLPLPTPPKED